MVGGDPAIDHAASMEEEKNCTLAKRDIVSMVASIFAVVEPKDIRLQVHGCAHCAICSVLVMLIDEHLPEATVHIERMQGKNVFRVLQANTPCAIDKISDFSLLGQAIFIVVVIVLGQGNFLKSCHWKMHQVEVCGW